MSKIIRIKNRSIGPDEPIFITAEIGCSHRGDFQAAKEMLLGAQKAGCDGADMFIASPDDFYAAHCPEGRQAWEKQGLAVDEWRSLFHYADEIGIILYLTPLDMPSVKMAVELGSPMLNINSDLVTDLRFLKLVGSLKVPLSMHDIGCTLAEIQGAVQILQSAGCEDLILLHSTLELEGERLKNFYATANLRVMDTYRTAFRSKGVLVGCVEHTSSKFLIYGVSAREPVLISKHIIVKHTEGAPDNQISFELKELQSMVQNVRAIEMSLGSGMNCMITNKYGQMEKDSQTRRKILVAAKDISQGKVVDKNDIIAKRSWVEGGLHPWKMLELYGAKAKKNISKDEILNFNMFYDFVVNQYKFPDIEKFGIQE